MRLSAMVMNLLLPAGVVGVLACLAAAPGDNAAKPLLPTKEMNAAAAPGAFPGITKPSERRQMSLRISNVIREVKVKPGDRVKVGQILIIEDTSEEESNRDIARLEAESEVAVRAAEITRDIKRTDARRVANMLKEKVATQQEWEKADLEAKLAEWDIKKAEQERAKWALQAKGKDCSLANMRMVSPIDGIVEDVLLKEGEVVDPQKPAIIVVKNDPLWVEVYLPTSVVRDLKEKQALSVRYTGEAATQQAAVILCSPVADAASDMQLVRLEMPNPTNRYSGLRVEVLVSPAKGGEAAAR
jgi:RND family efflux transporter MFP subunit